MNVEVSLLNANLKAEQMPEHHMAEIITGFFSTLQGAIAVPQKTVANVHDVQIRAVKLIPVDPSKQVTSKSSQPESGTTATENPTKFLPKINAERTLSTSVGEVLQDALNNITEQEPADELIEQEYWKTGIKEDDDGTKRYRCYYWCDCGSKGKRYIEIGHEYVNCRDCGEELLLEAATPNVQTNGLPERDNYGNFFIARERY